MKMCSTVKKTISEININDCDKDFNDKVELKLFFVLK